jgi:hypothetical protein
MVSIEFHAGILMRIADPVPRMGRARTCAGKDAFCHEQQADDLRGVLQMGMRTVENSPAEKKSPLNFSKGLFYYIISSSCSLHL